MLKDICSKLISIVSMCSNINEALNEICILTSHSLNCNILILNSDGQLIDQNDSFPSNIFNTIKKNNLYFIERTLNEQLLSISKNKFNLKLNDLYVFIDKKNEAIDTYVIIVPLFNNFKRCGTMVFYRKNVIFSIEELDILNYILVTLILIVKQIQQNELKDIEVKVSKIKWAISLLSYSELEAVLIIFLDFSGNDKVVVATKIAENFNITPSIIGNALRTLESSGIIETRSLGMKGTYIKIVNEFFISELSKLK